MKKINKYLVIIFLILIISLTGCSNNSNNENDLKEKAKSELKYIEKEIVNIMNRLNNISFSNYEINLKEVPNTSESSSSTNIKDENNNGKESKDNSNKNQGNVIVTEMIEDTTINKDYSNIKWNELESSLELFVGIWNTIILDLYKLNINGNEINEFSNYLDKLVISIKNKDKIAGLNNASILYSYIPKYLEDFDKQPFDKELLYTKLHILYSYVGATTNNWDYTNSELKYAEDSFSNIMNNNEFTKNRGYNINKSYVAIKELQNSSILKDFNIYIIKYKNTMQEMLILD